MPRRLKRLKLPEPDTEWVSIGLMEYAEFFGTRSLPQLVKKPASLLADERRLMRWVAVQKAIEEGLSGIRACKRAAYVLGINKYDNVEAVTIEDVFDDMNDELMAEPMQAKFYPTRRVRRLAHAHSLDEYKG